MHPVLVRLSALGVRVSADGSQLRVAPRSAITDEVRQLVRIHKDELLTALEAETRLRQLAAELRPAGRGADALLPRQRRRHRPTAS